MFNIEKAQVKNVASHNYAGVAQQVAQDTCNVKVAGSIPASGTSVLITF